MARKFNSVDVLLSHPDIAHFVAQAAQGLLYTAALLASDPRLYASSRTRSLYMYRKAGVIEFVE